MLTPVKSSDGRCWDFTAVTPAEDLSRPAGQCPGL